MSFRFLGQQIRYSYGGISLLIGLSLAVSCLDQFSDFLIWPTPKKVLLGTGLLLFFTLITYGLLFTLAWPRLAGYSTRVKVSWIVISLLVGELLIVVWPIHTFRPSVQHTLEVIATGQKNPQAQDSQVWIRAGRWSNGTTMSINELQLFGPWEVQDRVLFSAQDQPASLNWTGMSKDDLNLVFLARPWSGIVEVRWDGQQHILDLYNSFGTQRTITLPRVVFAQKYPLLLFIVGLNMAYSVSLGMMVFVVTVWLITRPINNPKPLGRTRWVWAGYAIPLALVWMLWLLAYWPGIMSPDFILQWQQILNGQFHNQSPPFHTMVTWLLTRFWLTPAIVALFQIASLSAVAGWGFVLARRLGAPAWLTWVACLIFVFFPVNSIFIINLGKDVPYSISFLVLTLLVLLIVNSQGIWLQRRGAWLSLGLIAALTALFRYNGPPAAFGTLLALGVIYRKQWRPVIYALIVAIGLWWGVTGPFYQLVGVRGNVNQYFLQYLTIHQIAAHLDANTPLTSTERDYLDQISPVNNGWPYSCYAIRRTVELRNFDWDPISQDTGKFFQTYLALLARNPGVNLTHLVCHGSLIWEITQPRQAYGYTEILTPPIDEQNRLTYIAENSLGLEPSPLLPGLALWLGQIILLTQKGDIGHYLLALERPAIYLYLLLAGVAIAAGRARSWKVLLIALPILIHSFFLNLMMLTQEARYQYPVYLVILILWPALYFSNFLSLQKSGDVLPITGESDLKTPGATYLDGDNV